MKVPSIVLFAVLMGATTAYAQSASAPPVTAPSNALPCADFRHNSDGSWTAVAPVTIADSNGLTIQISPSMPPFRAGVLMSGLDLGALLDQQCSAH